MEETVSLKRTLLCRALPALCCAAVVSAPAAAAIRLPHVLSSHMVLERDAPVHLWGWAEPGEAVTVQMDGLEAKSVTDALGRWSVYLAPHAAGGPYTVRVTAPSGSATLKDVLVGDVWIASGQSNMEMPLAGFGPGTPVKGGEQAIAAADNPRLRLLVVRKRSTTSPVNDAEDSWTTCTPAMARGFSAAAYFFAREIAEREGVPVGVVDSSWGGTPAESWVSLEGLTRDANLAPVLRVSARFLDEQAARGALLAAEKREDEAAKAAGRPAPTHDWHPEAASWIPSALFNGMIAPFTPMTLRGFLWYQGETNSGLERAPLYSTLFPALIMDWRRAFGQGELPFLFVQISSFRSSPREAWGVLRDAQRRTLSVSGTGMAVTLDVGNPTNVHPADKETVGHRLALAARAEVYGEHVVFSGPLFERATMEGEGARVWFTPATADGLACADKSCAGFEVAGADHRFVAAEAKVEGRSVLARAAGVLEPRYVRYAWANAPPISLVNGAGLPGFDVYQ